MSAQPYTELRRWRCTVDQFEQMGRSGVFDEDDRVELLDGEIVSMPGIGPSHASVVDRLTMLLVQRLAGRAIVRVQNPVRLPPYSEPQPDLTVLAQRDDFYATRHPGPDDIQLVIEVCDSSLAIDRGVKVPIYARAGLPQVWLVDVKRRVILTHRNPVDDGYTTTATLRPNTTIATGAPLDMELYVSSILG